MDLLYKDWNLVDTSTTSRFRAAASRPTTHVSGRLYDMDGIYQRGRRQPTRRTIVRAPRVRSKVRPVAARLTNNTSVSAIDRPARTQALSSNNLAVTAATINHARSRPLSPVKNSRRLRGRRPRAPFRATPPSRRGPRGATNDYVYPAQQALGANIDIR